jgi:hypothetical protein
MNIVEKIGRLKELRGKHDQTMRCGVIDVLYRDQIGRWNTVTEAFLEDAILMLEEQHYAKKPVFMTDDDRERGQVMLWPAGDGSDAK